jgi:GTP pyrophosphokinase
LRDILSRLSDQNINVRNAGVKTSHGKPALISLSIDIQDREQLDRTISQIKNMSDVLDLRRIGQTDSDPLK